jgi:putative ABC transport system ATP-binding protein
MTTQAATGAVPLLAVRGLCKDYGGAPVFAHVDLQLTRGEFVAILGESGVGKSTLLNCIAGLDSVQAGTVHIQGTEITAMAEDAQALFRRAHLGFVFQAFHVLPHLSVAHNVALPLLLQRQPDDARVREVLEAVGLQSLADRLPQTLSGGQLQRVAIARALANHPALLIADEPTGNLDPATSSFVFDTFRKATREEGTSALVATHNLDLARQMDRVFRIEGGLLVQD